MESELASLLGLSHTDVTLQRIEDINSIVEVEFQIDSRTATPWPELGQDYINLLLAVPGLQDILMTGTSSP